jgi:uncharacterized OsmC-like protein
VKVKVDLGFDQERLTGLIDRIRESPASGRTVSRATTRWREGFRSEATIGRRDRAHTVAMDEPASMGGSDTAPNMVEMVLSAYGCCLISGFVANAALSGIELEGVEIEVEGDLDLQGFLGLRHPDEVWPGCTEVRARISLSAPTATADELRELHDRVVRTSPVGNIMTRPVAVRTELRTGPGR